MEKKKRKKKKDGKVKNSKRLEVAAEQAIAWTSTPHRTGHI